MIIIDKPKKGDTLDAKETAYPSRLEVLSGFNNIEKYDGTAYGYVVAGRAQIKLDGFCFEGDVGTFFCIPGEFQLNVAGLVAVIFRFGYKGLLSAGRLETAGRLAYLNGCSSTVLVPPPKSGDPVFNHLHIPHGVDQTQHTHPSIRLGVVVSGSGLARGHDTERNGWQKFLSPGCIFMLQAGELHGFSTMENLQELDLITYHPDSDWGPTDDNHPMLSTTILAGASQGMGERA